MQVLIIGGGGREHALAWKAAQSPQVKQVYVAPGNAGTALEPKTTNINIKADDIEKLAKFANDKQVDLTIVGPEAPLAAGIVDHFKAVGLPCFGPGKRAAQLESSKAFSKEFMQRYKIPTAAYQSFTDVEQAIDYLSTQRYPLVIKADGLAAGKGVVIANDEQTAVKTIKEMLSDGRFGHAGNKIVIEEFLEGEEASFIVICDGEHVLPLASSQDHKARDDGDQGPNTGGMGAYSPAPVITDQLHQQIMQEIITPTLEGMKKDHEPYTGFLYAGLMITSDGPKVLEYNCRLGDPETQPIMMRLRSDLVELCQYALTKRLGLISVDWDPRPALTVVLTAGGYPDKYSKGDIIHGLPADQETVKVFHAGTVDAGDQILTNGGRVLCITSLADTIVDAQQAAYSAITQINFSNMYYRKDIGYKALARPAR